ncbi:hypothetical protein M5K25_018584 [Dendrobium thyrsiflorum]|uniref:Uncharacterized protein n=1 Tax=Dendrobium thyrsiflorum TaxID=117978 RepID=A0ABD0UJ15_DENTH
MYASGRLKRCLQLLGEASWCGVQSSLYTKGQNLTDRRCQFSKKIEFDLWMLGKLCCGILSQEI